MQNHRFFRLACTAVLVLMFGLALGCGRQVVIGLAPAGMALQERELARDRGAGSDKVALIEVTGVLLNRSESGAFGSGENPVSQLAEQLKRAAEDRRVRAVVLRINSPGGGVTATAAMHDELQRFKAKTGKPVVVMMMDVAASGGTYLAMGGDWIVAYPSTVTGSIGVIIQWISVEPALRRWGIDAEAITSGPNKAAGSPFEPIQDESRATLQRLVDQFQADFIATVRQARPNLDDEALSTLADGRVISGNDALAFGLVDQLGTLHDAVDAAKAKAGLSAARLVRYHRPLQSPQSIYSQAPVPAVPHAGAPLADLFRQTGGATVLSLPTGFYYLWHPSQP